MSIVVNNLNKFYGKWQALKNINFSINKGDILGFLGPNGAGKTTTMKIITTLLKPSSGQILINGIDICKEPTKVVPYIGYLPENNPLYTDFYVIEALDFIAKIRRCNIKSSTIKDMLERTGLSDVKNKKVKTLSKGYKQRLGIAQAIIHNPEILILDEPANGLDPIQIIEIRKLIKGIAANKAVLISTHIMQEVEAVCNKIMVLKNGEIVAKEVINKTEITNLNTFKIEFNKSVNSSDIRAFINPKYLQHIEQINNSTLLIQAQKDIRANLMDFAINKDLVILHLSLENKYKSLEEVFTKLSK
ncbi:MAG: ATP-binding cassette domain-containing protein [Solitalea-like symbiont of Acarus siro]